MAEPKGGTAVISESRGKRLISLLTLKHTRATLRGGRGRMIATSIAIFYGSIALIAGFMLQVGPTGASGTTVRILTNSYSPAWWNYPAVLVTTPGGSSYFPAPPLSRWRWWRSEWAWEWGPEFFSRRASSGPGRRRGDGVAS